MKIRSLLLALIAAVWCTPLFAIADEARQTNFVVFPIKTDLQRELLNSRADAYLQLDVESYAPDGKFDPKRFDRVEIRKALTDVARQVGKDKPRIFVGYRYTNGFLNANQRETLENAVRGACGEARFGPGGTSMLGEGGSWRDKLAPFSGVPDDANAIESPLEDEFVRVYPVRTALSRFALGKADCDCYVVLRQPIERNFKDFSLETRLAINQLLAQLNLARRDHLVLYCMTTKAGQATAERYFQRGGTSGSRVAIDSPRSSVFAPADTSCAR